MERQLRNTVPTPLSQAATANFAEIPATAPTVTPVPANMRIPFVLCSVRITGSTVYSEESLRTFYQPYLNKRISYQELEKIVSGITLKYVTDGYVLSHARIPIQNLSAGHVTIEILKAYVANANVQGKTHGIENFLVTYI